MIRRWIERQTTAGLRSALRRLGEEVMIQWHHRRALRRLDRYRDTQSGALKLNLGCGPNRKSGWVNIDLATTADLRLDLRQGIPLPDGSAAIIYSEHFFEHLDYPNEARRFLGEARRVLAPGGRFRVGVPDAASILRDYVADDRATFRWLQERWHPAWCTTPMHSVNYLFRQGGEHKYAYDEETLSHILAEAGFVSIARQPYEPALDSAARREGTLYIDAYAPAAGTDLAGS